jgi:endonuclease YncB( thermonuclease family)
VSHSAALRLSFPSTFGARASKVRALLRVCASAGLLVALCLAQSVRAETLLGVVVAVSDGDTVTVRDSNEQTHKIRLAGIDAPESRQPYGDRSRQSLIELVAGQSVEVVYDKVDRYGRRVGTIHIGGRDANLEQVRRGLAWHYKQYEAEQTPADRQRYAAAEKGAQAERLGLWREASPQAPWDYRRQLRVGEPQ